MLLFVLWLVVVIPSAGGVLQVSRFGGILTVGKELSNAEEGFIIYPTVDTWRDRNVEIVCARDVTFSSIPTTPSASGELRFNVSLSMNFVRPECSGRMNVCVGPDTVFRKRRGYVRVRCTAVLQTNPTVVTMPHPEVMETITPGLYTWFMGHSQYEEMRNKGATTVFIPYLNYFSLPILVPLYHHEGLKYECYFKAPRTGETKITNLQVDYYSIRTKWYQVKRIQYFTVFRKRIPSVSGFHGEYSVRCRGLYWNTPTNSAYWSPWVTQRLKLIMFKGVLIRVRSPMHMKVVFPSWATTGTFAVDVITTSAMKEFHIERSDGVAHEQQILVEFIAYNKYNLTAEYRVALPWMTEHTTGIYTISVANKDREQKKINMKVEKAEALRVLVSPSQQIVGEGARVSFDCLVLGHPIHTIGWIRDFDSTDINPNEVPIEITKLSGDSRGLRLTFLSPKLLDSAYYACFAANQFERQQERVELAVFLPGSLYIDPNYEAPVGVSSTIGFEGARVLNISDEDILEEWNNSGDGKKGINGVAIGLSSSFAVAIITVGTVIGVLLCRMVYRKRQYVRLRSITKTRKATLEKTPLRQESRLQLIPNTFDKELDLVKEWLGSEAEVSEGGSDEELVMDCSHQGDTEGVFETLECDDGGDQTESGASKKGKDKAKGKRAKKGKKQEPDLRGFTEDGSKGRGTSKQKAEGGDEEAKTKSSDMGEKAGGRDEEAAKSKSRDKGEAKTKGREKGEDKTKSNKGGKTKGKDKTKSSETEKAKSRDKGEGKAKSSEGGKTKGRDKSKSRTKTEGKPKGSEDKKPKTRDDEAKSSERKYEDESVEGKDDKPGDVESSRDKLGSGERSKGETTDGGRAEV